MKNKMEKTKDEIVMDLLQVVKTKKEAIEKIKKCDWKTNCIFHINGKITNIRTISDINIVIKSFSEIVTLYNVHLQTIKLLNLDNELNLKFEYNGYTYEEWLNDFTNISNNIYIKSKLKDLEQDEAKLDKLVSKEKREELELELLLSKHS